MVYCKRRHVTKIYQGTKLSQSSIEFVNLFVRSPGDLIYFLIVIAVSQAAFFMALGQRLRRPQDRSAQRYVLAGAGVVATWVFLMIGALAALLTGQDPASVLPPLERAVTVSTILLLGWAFLTADHAAWPRTSNLVLLTLLAVVIGAYLFTGIEWPAVVSQMGFNQSPYGLAWAVIPTVLAFLGVVLTLAYFRLVADAPLKLLFFAVLVVGFGMTMLEMANGTLTGDYAGPARIAYLAALPIFPAVVYRLVIGRFEEEEAASPAQTSAAPAAVPAFEAPAPFTNAAKERESAQLMRALGIILEGATPGNIPDRIIQSVLQVLQADIGVLLSVQDANYASTSAGRDRVMGRSITGLSINLDNQPTLVNAIERRTQRPLYPDRNIDELRDLYTRFEIEQVGPAYFQPLIKERELLAVLVVGLPYAGRELDDSAQELLKGIGIIAANLLALSRAAVDEQSQLAGAHVTATFDAVQDPAIQAAWQQLQTSLEAAREKIVELNSEVTTLKVELDFERARVAGDLGDTAEELSISQQLLSLSDEEQRLADERDHLSSRLREAEAALAGATATDNETVLKTLVDVLQREIEDLTERRSRLEGQVSELRAGRTLSPSEFVREMVTRLDVENARLEVERDQLGDQVMGAEAQLKALGIEGGLTGLAQLVAQLFEQRSGLQNRAETLQRERDALLTERQWLEDRIASEEARDKQLFVLQTELKNVAEDREAIARQHDRLKSERDELLVKQDSLKEQRARLTAEVASFEQELEEMQAHEQALRAQIEQLTSQRNDLAAERDRLQTAWQALAAEREQRLRTDGEDTPVQPMGEERIGRASRLVDDVSLQRDQLDRELEATRAQLAALEGRLETMRALSTAQGDLVTRIENAEVLSGMIYELNTPLTSIMNYIDLLLSESAGILGEMQRNFLQRVRANGQRLEAMLDDLMRVSVLDSGQFELATQAVDVIATIEDAITGATPQLQERGLSIHLNLDDDVPPLQADPDAIDQIVGQLLTNAYLASPPGSDLFVTARRQSVRFGENGTAREVDSLFLSIEDRGGGIAPEDLPRVFSRKYKAENPLIPGLGDTGVGLSIAKALVEAHGGRLWLETFEQVGSAFNVALPLEPLMYPEGQ
jgi:signal transduction histidine kinase